MFQALLDHCVSSLKPFGLPTHNFCANNKALSPHHHLQLVTMGENPRHGHGILTPQHSRAGALATKESCAYLDDGCSELSGCDADRSVVKYCQETAESEYPPHKRAKSQSDDGCSKYSFINSWVEHVAKEPKLQSSAAIKKPYHPRHRRFQHARTKLVVQKRRTKVFHPPQNVMMLVTLVH